MGSKKLLLAFLFNALLNESQAAQELIPKESRNISSYNENRKNFGECRDYVGRTIAQGMHYVPSGPDFCKLCVCSLGKAKSCRAVLCTPPADCKKFQTGSICCEFICLDEAESKFSDLTLKTILTIALGAVSLLLVLICCICGIRRCKTEFDEKMKEKKMRRIQNQAGTASNFTFEEDVYVHMSVEMIKKDELITALKEKIQSENRFNSPDKISISTNDGK